MDNKRLYKVAIVGPESTGKSTIVTQLASHFDTISVPEFAREYCKDLNRNYTLEDEINIFYGQLSLEEKMEPLAQNNLLFYDTMVLTVKIWCDHLFGATPESILVDLKKQYYDLYLLMDIDLPWEDDELRDFPNLRAHFMEIWHKELKDRGANYVVVSGLGADRFESARAAVEQFLLENQK
ncbi:MAG TPA: ATP-binding protein [Sphingobacteriaceae bacterium]|nr:ATP-binding protein [Sphingobacteriaceae bacterium]